MPGVPFSMQLILLPIELLGTLTKPFALMIRLFANMSAGHIVVMSLIGLIYFLKRSSWSSFSSTYFGNLFIRSIGGVFTNLYLYYAFCIIYWYGSSRTARTCSLIVIN